MRVVRAIITGSIALLLTLPSVRSADARCALPYVLSNGEVPDAAKMMANFNALVACQTVAGTANAIEYNAGSGALAAAGPQTNGQLIIGSTGAAPQAQTLTAGSGISITAGSGAVAIAATAGTAGTGLYRQVMSSTPTAASTGLTIWLNQGASAVSNSPTGITIDAPSSAATNLSGRYVTAPSAPYTITALIGATRTTIGGGCVGIGWYDGSSKIQGICYYTNSSNDSQQLVAVRRYTSPTAQTSDSFTSGLNGFSEPIWFRISDDGTNVSFGFSYDGANFLPVYSTTKAMGFLGSTGYNKLLFFVDPGSGSHTFGTLLSWTQT
jgi:hypothetical protein